VRIEKVQPEVEETFEMPSVSVAGRELGITTGEDRAP